MEAAVGPTERFSTSTPVKVSGKTESNFLIAPISGIIEVTTSHPLDRIKTKMQEMILQKRTPSVVGATKEIYQTTGMKGYYSGYVARVLGIMPMRLVYWESMRHMNKRVEGQSRAVQIFVPGIVVGCAQSLIDNPIEVLKVRQMTGESKTAISNITKGFFPTLYRNIIFSIAVSFSVKAFGDEYPFAAGAVGGFIGSVISQPLDVVKTEMQRFKGDSKNGMVTIFSEIYRRNPRELFTGTLMRGSMGFVNMGVGFLAFKHIYAMVSQY